MSQAAPVTLTQEQIDLFHANGYLKLDRITTDDDVAALRDSYDRIFTERAGREEGNQFDLGGTDEDPDQATLPQILGPAKYAPEMDDSILKKNVEAIARQLVDRPTRVGFAHAIFKPAGHGAATPWHQDAAYWKASVLHKSLSVWVPLQEATLANGCMHFVPGSHKLDVLPHRSINNDPRIHGLELDPSQMHRTEDAVACPLPAGGCTIHGGYTLHYTPPNRSDIPRRALILGIHVDPEPRESGPDVWPWLAQQQTARAARAKAAGKSDNG